MLLLVLILGMDQLQGIDLTLDLLLGLLLALLMAYMVFGWLTLSVRRVTLTNVRIRLSITTLRIESGSRPKQPVPAAAVMVTAVRLLHCLSEER